jgi:predicted DNA-binding antitoxin AbrB/MazE fold protein
MMQTITATFENGVFKPAQQPNLPEHSKVRLIVEPLTVDKEIAAKLAALQAFWKKTRPHSKHLTRDQLHERR